MLKENFPQEIYVKMYFNWIQPGLDYVELPSQLQG